MNINEPQLQPIDSTLSIELGRLASYSTETRVNDSRLELHPASFRLNTEGRIVLVRESCQNNQGRIVKTAESLNLTAPKLLLLPSGYDVDKIGTLVNHPSFITVEGEESYSLVLVPENFTYNKGELSHGKIDFFHRKLNYNLVSSFYGFSQGSLKLLPISFDEKFRSTENCERLDFPTELIQRQPEILHAPTEMTIDPKPKTKLITSRKISHQTLTFSSNTYMYFVSNSKFYQASW